jgi:3-hydroxyisobutyrate dehydrogenase-like beta-hydroxyacid dehydrogenase
MQVGFVGLGRMGQGMARRLLDAGHQLTVYNRTPEKSADLAKAGATVAASIAEAAHRSEVLVSMLADDAALETVTLGEKGLLGSLTRDAVHMAMGTHSVGVIRRLAETHAKAGQHLVSAPVLGRPDRAAAGELGIIAAGAEAALARCRPLLPAMGKRIFEAGTDPIAAACLKVANNFVLGCAIEAMGEAFALVRKHEVPPAILYDVLTEVLFAAPAYKIYGKIIADQDYDKVGITAVLGLKDCNLALAASDAARVPLPAASIWRDHLLAAIAQGDGQRDWSVMALAQARASGLA